MIRDRFSPDAWRALTDLSEMINAPFEPAPTESAMFERINGALRIIASFSGLAQENISQLAGWRYLELGRRIERAIATCRFVRQFAFGPISTEGSTWCWSSPTARSPSAALRDGGGAAPVIDLVVLDPNNPRSLVYQLDRIETHLAALPKRDDGRLSPPEQIATALADQDAHGRCAAIDDATCSMPKRR